MYMVVKQSVGLCFRSPLMKFVGGKKKGKMSYIEGSAAG